MSTIAANKTIVCLGRETTYGTAFTTPTIKLPDMMEYTFGKEQITIPQKTQTLAPMIKISQAGRDMPTVTISGVLTADHEELLVATFGDVASPYVIAADDIAANAAGYSYTIIQAVPAASDDLGTGVVATGCRLETFNISKNGTYIGYSATFKAVSVDDQVSLSAYVLTGITDTTYPELVPFLWQDTTASILDTAAVTELNTFSLDLTNEYVDDDLSFQNSATRKSLSKCGTTGTLSAEWIYDTVKDATAYDNLLSQTPQTDTIILLTGDKRWTIVTEGQYTDYTKPDKEKCLFVSNFTKSLLGTTAIVPITVTVATLP